MQEIVIAKKSINELTLEDKQKLVGAFAWLIQEDKKQNPSDYQLNNSEKQ